MTDVIAVCASARRKGNSELLLDKALEGMDETTTDLTIEKVRPRELSITPCRSCNACWDTGQCVIQDEMQDMYTRFCEADHVVISSPIYFTSLPGHTKVFIDRFQCFWVRTYRLDDPPSPPRSGAFLCVGAMERQQFFQCAFHIIKTWLSTLNISCPIHRFYPHLDDKHDVIDHPDYQQDAYEAGHALIQAS